MRIHHGQIQVGDRSSVAVPNIGGRNVTQLETIHSYGVIHHRIIQEAAIVLFFRIFKRIG